MDFFSKYNLALDLKWILFGLSFAVLYFARAVIVWLCLKLKKTQAHFDQTSFMHFFFEQPVEKPISWVFISTLSFATLEYLAMPETFARYFGLFLKLLMTYNVIRVCYMAAEALGEAMIEWAKKTDTHFDDQLAPFASRTLKVMVIIIGVLIGLQNFGVNVTALLAGLGIGGVALAFAAQDTVANVFGTITIILDRPFKLGDHIKAGDTEGTIEEVGFRSTRIRTFYNSVVNIPNSVMAKEKIDNMSERNGWVRFRHILGFTYDATTEQLGTFSEQLRSELLQDPTIDRDRVAVNFNAFGDSSLNVLVNFHYHLNEGDSDVIRINSYLNLISKVAANKKLSFAFPTRTLLVSNLTANGAKAEPQSSSLLNPPNSF